MERASLSIARCPPHRFAEALALVLTEIAPSHRREIVQSLLKVENPEDLFNEPLIIATRGEELRGAAWGQRQTGNIAMFWPPQLASGETSSTAIQLADVVVRRLDDTAIEMTQSLLTSHDDSSAPILEAVGFSHLADLLYMNCESERFPSAIASTRELEFEAYDGTKRGRLIDIIARTYEKTLDCVGLDGMRSIDDVINGYQGTGTYRASFWQFVRSGGKDVGLLLMAEHTQAKHLELMYMGLAPEVRKRGWGRQIVEHAKWLAGKAHAERIVLAADSKNTPALQMYRAAGFEIWDRRTVFVRFPPLANS
jgi:mycothiol synthase